MDLVKLVERPTWRDILIKLVEKNEMDPWDVDIIKITNGFIEQIKKMKMLDLKIPANLLLAAAILLKFKSRVLNFEEEEEGYEEDVAEESADVGEYVIIAKQRFPRKKRLGLNDLMKAMEEAIKIEHFKSRKRIKTDDKPPVILKTTNIDERLNKVYEKIKKSANKDGLVLFSNLLEKKTSEEIINLFVPIIYLADDNKIHIWQEELFGDLFLKVM